MAADPQPDPDTPAQAAAQGFTGGGQGYLRDDGRFRRIAVPGATGTLPYGINNRGQIVGVYDDARGRSHGFVWERGRFRTIDHPRATGTIPGLISGGGAFGINNRAQIVGVYASRDGHLHGYLWERGRFHTIADPPHTTDTAPIDINRRVLLPLRTPDIAPSSQGLEPPRIPGRFTVSARELTVQRQQQPAGGTPHREVSADVALGSLTLSHQHNA